MRPHNGGNCQSFCEYNLRDIRFTIDMHYRDALRDEDVSKNQNDHPLNSERTQLISAPNGSFFDNPMSIQPIP